MGPLDSQTIEHNWPDQCYQEYVNCYLLEQDANAVLDRDPFRTDVPLEQVGNIYVRRAEVEREVVRPNVILITGRPGSGKSTLGIMLPKLCHGRTLDIHWSLHTSTAHGRPPTNQLDNLLEPETLVRAIFCAYCRNLYQDYSTSTNAFQPAVAVNDLKQNPMWVIRLRWFAQHITPTPDVNMAVLAHTIRVDLSSACELYSLNLGPQQTLCELIDFVTYQPLAPAALSTLVDQRLYWRIQILIDEAECLTDHTFRKLLHDAHQLIPRYDGRLQAKIFARLDRQGGAQIEGFPQQWIYHLPCWTPDDLHDVLNTRLAAFKPGEYLNPGNEDARQACRKNLLALLMQHFDRDELKSLCFDLEVDYENLNDTSKRRMAEELIAFCERWGCVSQLVNGIEKARPGLVPNSLLELARNVSPEPIRSPVDYNWGRRLFGVSTPAQLKFVNMIVHGAMKAYDKNVVYDTPIHVLRLATMLVHKCATHWQAHGSDSPLTELELQADADAYWSAE